VIENAISRKMRLNFYRFLRNNRWIYGTETA